MGSQEQCDLHAVAVNKDGYQVTMFHAQILHLLHVLTYFTVCMITGK